MIKTEQEQIEAMKLTIPQTIVAYDMNPQGQHLYGEQRLQIAEELIKAGYGDVSEYKAEIERLRQEVRDTDKMARNTIEQYRAENKELENALKQSDDNYSRAFERLKAQGREIEKLKQQVKQAVQDFAEKLKEKLHYDYIMPSGITDERCVFECIDELIKEVQNETV